MSCATRSIATFLSVKILPGSPVTHIPGPVVYKRHAVCGRYSSSTVKSIGKQHISSIPKVTSASMEFLISSRLSSMTGHRQLSDSFDVSRCLKRLYWVVIKTKTIFSSGNGCVICCAVVYKSNTWFCTLRGMYQLSPRLKIAPPAKQNAWNS